VTLAESLIVARDNYAAQLVALSDPAKRKVSYSIGNRSVSWTEYQRFLYEQLKAVEEHLNILANGDGSADLVTAIP
jgi:hypothetical protein